MDRPVKNAARKGTALGVGATGGLALGVLLLPQIASTLNPTKLGTTLLTIVLALLTAAGQRVTERRKQRSAIGAAVRAWPPERLGSADLATLGVYPPRGVGGQPQPYRSRDEDAKLRKSLGRSKAVVVHGPHGAGKSRAAAEAGRRVLGRVPAVIPLNADALRSLADGSVQLNLHESRICLWLDDLNRFIEALDPCTLESLDGLAPEVKIVGTIRGEQWEDLLSGTGPQSQAARALDAGAEVLELGPLGGGTACSKQGAVRSDPGQPPVRALRPPWRDRWLVTLGVGVFATLVPIVIFGLAGDLLEPPPLEEQMGQIKQEVLRDDAGRGRHVVIDRRVPFHPTGADSWVLVVEDRPDNDEFYRGAANGVGRPPRSDELRIYDVHHDRLRLKLRFQPKGVGAKAAEWRELTEGPPAGADYDSDGANELIAGYAIPAQATSALVPFAIDWDKGSYQLISLTPDKPALSTRGLDRKTIKYRREAYQERKRFENVIRDRRFKHLSLTGYRIQAFALAEKPTRRLLSGYFAKFPQGQPRVLELHASQIRNGRPKLAECTPNYPGCRAPEREQDVIVASDRSPDGALLGAWSAVGSKWVISPIRVIERKR